MSTGTDYRADRRQVVIHFLIAPLIVAALAFVASFSELELSGRIGLYVGLGLAALGVVVAIAVQLRVLVWRVEFVGEQLIVHRLGRRTTFALREVAIERFPAPSLRSLEWRRLVVTGPKGEDKLEMNLFRGEDFERIMQRIEQLSAQLRQYSEALAFAQRR